MKKKKTENSEEIDENNNKNIKSLNEIKDIEDHLYMESEESGTQSQSEDSSMQQSLYL